MGNHGFFLWLLPFADFGLILIGMKEIKANVLGKDYSLSAYSTVADVFEAAGLLEVDMRYQDNPIVGALVNNDLLPLGAVLPFSCEIQPIRAYQSLGRRIYRHSICFLLCYANRLLYPERRLVIGHSLGDGFYFNYKEGEASAEQVRALSDKMRELVEQAIPIDYDSLSNEEAMSILKTQGFDDAVMLLKSRNNPCANVYRILDYCHIAYEPIVSNTSVLGVWELRKYGSCGMLLRYPVRDSIQEVVPFKDNDKMFEVFSEYRTWGKILGVRCVGEMNRRCLDDSAAQYVRMAESLQRRKISSIADTIHSRGSRAVFIAGPSSSGKTTFAKKLCEQLTLLGHSPIQISLDDYYKQRELAPKDADGKPDLEALEALDLDLFDANMQDLFAGKDVDLPHFSFAKNQTYYLNQSIRMNSDTIFVIEGLHGLNPRITSKLDPAYVFKVYISALTQLNMDDCNRVSTTDDRMMRRILRDYRTRATSAEQTLNMWPSVSRGERIHIFPNQNNADVMFNSALDYELGVLSPFVTPLLHDVGPQSGQAYTQAQRLLKFLENIYPISSRYVPSDSILREFIGGSDYE